MTHTSPAYLSACLLFCLLVAGSTASAHHSYRGNFEHGSTVTVTGTVSEYRLEYPHTHIVLKVIDDEGLTSFWTLETHSPNLLKRFGWDESTLETGDRLRVEGTPAKTANNYLRILEVTFEDGEVVLLQKR